MNRRNFFKTLATATMGFTILPPSTTYQRVWRARCSHIIPPPTPFDPMLYAGRWTFSFVDFPPLYDPRIVEDHAGGLYKPHPFPRGVGYERT